MPAVLLNLIDQIQLKSKHNIAQFICGQLLINKVLILCPSGCTPRVLPRYRSGRKMVEMIFAAEIAE